MGEPKKIRLKELSHDEIVSIIEMVSERPVIWNPKEDNHSKKEVVTKVCTEIANFLSDETRIISGKIDDFFIFEQDYF